MHKQRQQQLDDSPPFKCGIFLSSASCTAEMKYLDRFYGDGDVDVDGHPHRLPIRIPTVHIWGAHDQTAPTGGADLSELCDPAGRLVVTHDGTHELPRGEYLTHAVHAIRRAVFAASR